MHFIGTYWALKNIRGQSTVPPHLPPLSILKPIKGIEEGLIENLESFIGLDYPQYELILCIDSEKDPSYPLLKTFLAKHPSGVSLKVGENKLGPNPKVNNLASAYPLTQFDLILISDSNVRASRDYLKKMMGSFKEGVGVVTSVVIGKGANQFGGDLESVFLNTFYARWMWICKKLENPAVIGKSMLFSKKEAERFGGLAVLSNYIAEDYMAGQAFEKLGKEVALCQKPIVQWIGNYKFKDFWKRHLRWGRIRRAQSPLLTLFEPVFFSTLSACLGAFVMSHLSPQFTLSFFLLHFGFWALCDCLLLWGEETLEWKIVYVWVVREILALPLFIHICCSSTVHWRGSPLKIKQGGLVTSL